MILVSDGTRRVVVGPAADGAACPECSAHQRVVVATYQVFGFFRFGMSWSRRYLIECRQCRAVLLPLARSDFDREHGNPLPYGHRFGFAAILVLAVASIAIHHFVGAAASFALAGLWFVAGLALWRTAWNSTFKRRRVSASGAE